MLRTDLMYHKHLINVSHPHHHLGSISYKGERHLTVAKVILSFLFPRCLNG